jgi:pRiA4b ORF-3-like protein
MPTPGRITPKTKILQLKIALAGVRPPVWRRVLVPGEITLAGLHGIVQVAMGWTDTHLHEFEIGDARYGAPDPDWGRDDVQDEARAKLFRLAAAGSRFRYTYDFGDDWRHDITVEKVLAPQPGARYPTCSAGRRACPPEDVGGPWGYPEFLAALDDPKHPDHNHWAEWIGGSFDPDRFDVAATDAVLDGFAWSSG